MTNDIETNRNYSLFELITVEKKYELLKNYSYEKLSNNQVKTLIKVGVNVNSTRAGLVQHKTQRKKLYATLFDRWLLKKTF